jgi:hypothetical protein
LTNKFTDTSRRWVTLTIASVALLLFVHSALNGWILFNHNFYNDPATAWIGSYPLDPMHVWAGFTVTCVLLNLNFGVRKRYYLAISLLSALVLLRWVDLAWGFAEWRVFTLNPTGQVLTGLLDELVDQLADSVGGIIACSVASFHF